MISQNVLAATPGPTYDASGRITNLRQLILNTLADTVPSQGLKSGVRWLFVPRGSYTWDTALTELDIPAETRSLRFYSDGATLYDTRTASSTVRFWFKFILDPTTRTTPLELRFEGRFTFDGSTGATPNPAPADSRAVVFFSGWGLAPFSTQTTTITGTAADRLSVTVSGVADFQAGQRVTLGSQGERVLSSVNTATNTLHFSPALALAVSTGTVSHVDERARGLYIGPDVTFQNLTYEASSATPPAPPALVDHAIRAENAADVSIHCNSSNVRGWTVLLEAVDDFLVSDCELRGNSWGAIELRRSCRRGVVANNRVYDCEGRFGCGVDFLGLNTTVGGSLVQTERIVVSGNYVHCRCLYGAGIRVKGARLVDVIGNTVEMYGAPGPQIRVGISFGTKQETEGTDRPGGACSDVWIRGNRVVNTASSEGDQLGGILGLNLPAVPSGSHVASNISIVDNELVEDGGRFTTFGIRYGGSPSGTDVEQQTNGLVIRGNYGEATCTGVQYAVGYGGIVVIANREAGSTSITDLEVQDNSLVSAYASEHAPGIRLYGRIVRGSLARNSVRGFGMGIARDYTYVSLDEYANSELGCVETAPYELRPLYGEVYGTSGKPSASTTALRRVAAGTLFREVGTGVVKGWYAQTRGQFSAQTAPITGTAADRLSVTVGGVADFEVGDQVTVGSQDKRVLSRVNAAANTLHFFQALASSISTGTVSHVAPVLVAVGEGARGATAERPTALLGTADGGFVYFDTTLVRPVFWSGSAWFDATGAAV